MERLRLTDPAVANTPLIECHEALVPVAGLHVRIRVDDSAENAACIGYPPNFLIRNGAAQRLAHAADSLPVNLALLVKETLRPARLQAFYFERRLGRIKSENPKLTAQGAIELTAQFIAPPTVAGHPGGGAIDLTLCTQDGIELGLGCPYDADEAVSGGACFSFFDGLAPAAQHNRRILFDALGAAGFVNYPFEWWHWSYGDRYWAASTGAPSAIYSAVAD